MDKSKIEKALQVLVYLSGLAPVNKQTHLEAEKAAQVILEEIKKEQNG